MSLVYDVAEENGLPRIVRGVVPGAKDLAEAVREHGPLSPTDTALTGAAVSRPAAVGSSGTHRITDTPAAHVRLGGSVGNARRPSRSAGAVGAFMSTAQEPGEEALRRVSVRWMSM
ncbi:predicted protein [Streptomyces viridosporus ATCC 14672]|uniref:Predicted protein n=1 Tax=Streptomyces viridosporus (strain ATCC 14672 / DSM 40746 / JCM 4963 / KCTC 9882 / NRRL B-12104 / FH 1290) TaxID=566461 RepID=D6A3Z7_STRV1|nr:predicted protein [Streptomyces viridosporus ATCC 14672]